ncbi:MAG: hypothetical protein WAW06_01105 [bacterium]
MDLTRVLVILGGLGIAAAAAELLIMRWSRRRDLYELHDVPEEERDYYVAWAGLLQEPMRQALETLAEDDRRILVYHYGLGPLLRATTPSLEPVTAVQPQMAQRREIERACRHFADRLRDLLVKEESSREVRLRC